MNILRKVLELTIEMLRIVDLLCDVPKYYKNIMIHSSIISICCILNTMNDIMALNGTIVRHSKTTLANADRSIKATISIDSTYFKWRVFKYINSNDKKNSISSALPASATASSTEFTAVLDSFEFTARYSSSPYESDLSKESNEIKKDIEEVDDGYCSIDEVYIAKDILSDGCPLLLVSIRSQNTHRKYHVGFKEEEEISIISFMNNFNETRRKAEYSGVDLYSIDVWISIVLSSKENESDKSIAIQNIMNYLSQSQNKNLNNNKKMKINIDKDIDTDTSTITISKTKHDRTITYVGLKDGFMKYIISSLIDPQSICHQTAVNFMMKYIWVRSPETRTSVIACKLCENLDFLQYLARTLSDPQSAAQKSKFVSLLDSSAHLDPECAKNILSHGNLFAVLKLLALDDSDPELAERAAGALHGIARNASDLLESLMQVSNLVNEVFIPIIKKAGNSITLEATIVQVSYGLSYLVGEYEDSILTRDKSIIKSLVYIFEKSLQHERVAGHIWGITGIIEPLMRISRSDANKPSLVDNGLFDDIVHIICIMYRNKDISIKILAKLKPELRYEEFLKNWRDIVPSCYSSSDTAMQVFTIMTQILFEPSQKCIERAIELEFDKLLAVIEKDTLSPVYSDEVASIVHRIIFSLDQHRNDKRSITTSFAPNLNVKSTVMISYSWSDQHLVLKFSRHLKSLGINVWIDVDNMRGSTIEAMARAVEASDCVLFVVSPSYKISDACRLEAEYALKLKKKMIPIKINPKYEPDGWLGIIQGSKLYYDIGEEYKLKESAFRIATVELRAIVNIQKSNILNETNDETQTKGEDDEIAIGILRSVIKMRLSTNLRKELDKILSEY